MFHPTKMRKAAPTCCSRYCTKQIKKRMHGREERRDGGWVDERSERRREGENEGGKVRL